MSIIRRWLEENGLGKYADLFVENEIDFDVLEEITLDELEKLGVPLGARKRMLRAISARSEAGPASFDELRSAMPTPSLAGQAEVRQLTVMFVDLVGSVDYGQRMDLEDYRYLLKVVREAILGAIGRFDGFVARHQGDGILAYFGYPQARENDAERSIRSGLAAVRAVHDLELPFADVRPKIRVGIATGQAVVGDVLATGASEQAELAALGPTPNLAARLQGYARPGTVVASDITERLARGFFETTKLTELELRGLDSPVTAFEISRELSVQTPSAALEAASSLSPLVGREGELSLIMERWGHAKRGAGQAVSISAEPGVGKSRLVHEIRGRIGSEAERIIVFYCSPYYTRSVLHPVAEALSRALRIEQDASASAKLSKLKDWLTELSLPVERSLPVFARLLSVPMEEPPVVGSSPEDLRRETLATILETLKAMAERGPVLLIAEDLHWVDPTSSELFGSIIEGIREYRVLALFTFRPEFQHNWRPQPHTTNLTLNHLTRDECHRLAEQLGGDSGFPHDVLAQIVARGDGVALFIEELSQVVLESGGATMSATIPATLRDTLTARLDRLGAAKRIAQLAAVIGRQFRRDWLAAASEGREQEVQAGLEALRSAGLLFSRPGLGDVYEFKHALVRDTAYDSLLREERERMHASVAMALQGSAEVPAEVLATHFFNAAQPSRAIDLWLEAREVAHTRGAHQEAVGHARNALSELERGGEQSQRTVEAAMNLGLSLHYCGHREQGMRILEQYEALLNSVATAHAKAIYYSEMGNLCGFLGRREDAHGYAERAKQYAVGLEDLPLVARIEHHAITEDIFCGNLTGALNSTGTVRALKARGATDAVLEWPRLCLGWAHWWAGDCHTSKGYAESVWRSTTSESIRAHASWILGGARAELGEFAAAIELLENTLNWADPFCAAIVHGAYSHGVFQSGDVDFGIRLLQESLARAAEYRSKQIQTWAALNLAYAYQLQSEPEKCEALLQRWRPVAIEIQALQLIGRADWIHGMLLLSNGELEESARRLLAARRQLESTGALGDAARVAEDMARVHKLVGSEGEARSELQRAFALWSGYSNDFQLSRLIQVAHEVNIALHEGSGRP